MYSSNSIKNITPHVFYFDCDPVVGIIEEKDSLILIDSGFKTESGIEIIKAVSEKFGGKKISHILNTHAHLDHCGGNKAINEAFGTKICTCFTASKLMEDPFLTSAIYWGGHPLETLSKIPFTAEERCPVDIILKDGDILDFTDSSIKAVSLDGHFFDQLGFEVTDRENGKTVFFLGDAFFGIKMIKKFWIPFIYNPEQFRQSAEKIIESKADFFIPAHGGNYDKAHIEAIGEYNLMITLELESLILRLLEVPKTSEQLIKEVADYAQLTIKLSQFVYIGSTIRSYLANMEKRGLIEYCIKDNYMFWQIKKHENQ